MGLKTQHPSLGKNKLSKKHKKFVLDLFKNEGGFRNKITSPKEREKVYLRVDKQFIILKKLRKEVDNSLVFNEYEIEQIMTKQIKYDLGEHKHSSMSLRIRAMNLMSSFERNYFAHQGGA